MFRDEVALSELRLQLGNLRRFEKDVALSVGARDEAAAYLVRWQKAAVDARKTAEGLLAASGHPAVKSLAAGIAQKLASYEALAQPVLTQASSGGFAQAQEANLALAGAKAEVRVVEETTNSMESELSRAAASLREDQQAAATAALWWFAVAVALSVVLVVPLTLANMVSICGPIDAATALAQRIAQGDYAFLARPAWHGRGRPVAPGTADHAGQPRPAGGAGAPCD